MRRVADFAKDGGRARAGGAGQVGRAAVKGLVGKNGEREGFLGVFGHAERGGWKNADTGQARLELRANQRIVREIGRASCRERV